MKTCYFDAFSGISGDMTVGALVDAGADGQAVIDALQSMNTGATFSFEKVKRRGIAATKFHVTGVEQKAHRHLPHIARMIEAGSLPGAARDKANAVFLKLGEAEAASHNVPIEQVHFHEVGAVDSIADIVGACVALELLGVEQVACSPLNVGSGTVETEHGTLPVPAPATARLLEGMPIYSRGPAMELTTPTGAAIVAALATHFGAMPTMTLQATGYGAGDRDFKEHANVLRATLGESRTVAEAESIVIMEANVDDATPQVLAYAMERLLDAGALDVTLTPLVMKKSRPGTLLRVLARPEGREDLARVLFAETTTLGLRTYAAERRVLPRETIEVDTAHGRVRVKVAEGGHFQPEYDDCRALALSAGVPLRDVLAAASLAYLKRTEKP